MAPWPSHLTALLVFSATQSYASTGGNAILYEVCGHSAACCAAVAKPLSLRASQYFNEWLDASDNMATFACSTVIVLNNVFGVIGALWADWRVGVRRKYAGFVALAGFMDVGCVLLSFKVYLIQIWTSVVWGVGSALIAFSAVSHSMKDEGRLALGLIGVVLTCIGSGVQGPTQSKFLGGSCSHSIGYKTTVRFTIATLLKSVFSVPDPRPNQWRLSAVLQFL
jgi:hypothetical protein